MTLNYMFDAADPKTSAVIDPMLANSKDVKHGMHNVQLHQVITDVRLLNVSDPEHIMNGIEQYGLKLNVKLIGFTDEMQHNVKLLRQDGADVADIDLADVSQRRGDSTVIYHLSKDEVNKLNDAGLYDEPKETLTDLRNALLGEEIHSEGAVRITTFKTEGYNFQIGQKRDVKTQEFECGLVSSMGYVTTLDHMIEDQNITDKLNTAILDVVSGLSLRKQAREEREIRKQVKYEMDNVLDGSMDNVDTYDETKEDKMHLTIANGIDLSGKQHEQAEDMPVETTKAAKDAPEINIDRAVDLRGDHVGLDDNAQENTKTLDERSSAPKGMKGKTFAEIQADQMKRIKELQAQNEERKRKAKHRQAIQDALAAEEEQHDNNDADKVANENLQRTIQTTVADDIDSSLPDEDDAQYDDEVSQFESEEEEGKRHKNQELLHTKRVDQTRDDGPQHQQAKVEKVRHEVREKQAEEAEHAKAEVKKRIHRRQKENDGPEM